MRGTALIVNGMPDHVHMLVRVRPVQSAAEIMRTVKTNHADGYGKTDNLILPGKQDMECSA
jgi:REP element-mobilizing transposase RayT